jgi:hypothetical protein
MRPCAARGAAWQTTGRHDGYTAHGILGTMTVAAAARAEQRLSPTCCSACHLQLRRAARLAPPRVRSCLRAFTGHGQVGHFDVSTVAATTQRTRSHSRRPSLQSSPSAVASSLSERDRCAQLRTPRCAAHAHMRCTRTHAHARSHRIITVSHPHVPCPLLPAEPC